MTIYYDITTNNFYPRHLAQRRTSTMDCICYRIHMLWSIVCSRDPNFYCPDGIISEAESAACPSLDAITYSQLTSAHSLLTTYLSLRLHHQHTISFPHRGKTGDYGFETSSQARRTRGPGGDRVPGRLFYHHIDRLGTTVHRICKSSVNQALRAVWSQQ